MNVREKTESLGGEIIPGPNAMYADGFPSRQAVDTFVAWLDGNGFTHGNVMKYPDRESYYIRYEK